MKMHALAALAVLMAAPAVYSQTFTKDWEALCGVDTSGDEVRAMSVYGPEGILVTLDRESSVTALRLYNTADGNVASPANMPTGSIPSITYSIIEGGFSDDGAFFACSLSYISGTILRVYYWTDSSAAPVEIYNSGSDWLGYRLGDAMDVKGSVSDNSVKVIISGNVSGLPLVLTTADNGSTWDDAFLPNAVHAQDIDLQPDGSFYGIRYASSDAPTLFNADGSSNTDLVYPTGWTAFCGIESFVHNSTTYYIGLGLRTEAAFVLMDAAGNNLADTTSDLIDGVGDFGGSANGSGDVEIVNAGPNTYEVYGLSERNGVAKWTLTFPNEIADWSMLDD